MSHKFYYEAGKALESPVPRPTGDRAIALQGDNFRVCRNYGDGEYPLPPVQATQVGLILFFVASGSTTLVDPDGNHVHAMVSGDAAILQATDERTWKVISQTDDGTLVNVRHYGAKGDDSTDDLEAFEAATEAAGSTGTIYIPNGIYRFSDTWVVAGTQAIVCDPNAWLVASAASGFTADRPLLWVDGPTNSVTAAGGIRGGLNIRYSGTISWSDEGNCGIRLQNVSQKIYELGKIYGFASGVQTYGDTAGDVLYMTRVEAVEIRGCKDAVLMKAVGGHGEVNGCHFRWGETSSAGASVPAGDANVWRTSGAPSTNNVAKNHFDIASVEGLAGTSSIAYLTCGTRNTMILGHVETQDRFFTLTAEDGNVTDNTIFTRTPQGDLTTTSSPVLVYPPQSSTSNEWWGNTVRAVGSGYPSQTWSSGNLADELYEVDGAGAVRIPGVMLVGFSTGTPADSDNGPDIRAFGGLHHERAAYFAFDHYPAVYVDTTHHKTLYVSIQSPDAIASSAYCRVAILAFKSDGTRYLPNTNSSDRYRVTMASVSSYIPAGEGWGLPGAVQDSGQVVSVDDTVAYVVVIITGGTSFKSFRVSTSENSLIEQPLRVWTAQRRRGQASGTAAPATKGTYPVGFRLTNQATGTTLGWRCTTAGTMAAAWAPSTAYTVGQLVKNDTNKIYVCITAGTSAGSGGPTGTGSAITDNTVVWNYYDALAVFTTETGN